MAADLAVVIQEANVSRRIIRNTLALGWSQISLFLLGAGLIIYLSRRFGDQGLGEYSLVLAYVGVLTTLSNLGLGTLIVRDVARDRSLALPYVRNFLGLRITSSMVVVTVAIAGAMILKLPPDAILSIAIYSVAAAVAALTDVLASVLAAFENFAKSSAITVMERSATSAIGILVIWLGGRIVELMTLFLAASLLSFAFHRRVVRGYGLHLRPSFEGRAWKEGLGRSWPWAVGPLLAAIMFQADTLILSITQGSSASGTYNAAYRLALLLGVVPAAFVNAIFPAMANLRANSVEAMKVLFDKSIKLLTIVAAPLALTLSLAARELIGLVYGSGFRASADPLALLVWAQALLFLNVLFSAMINVLDRQVRGLWVVGVAAALNVTANIYLIPLYGIMGAAAVSVATQAVGLIASVVLLREFLGLGHFRYVTQAGIACLPALTMHVLLPGNPLVPLAGLILYTGVLPLTRAVNREDMRLVRSVLGLADRTQD